MRILFSHIILLSGGIFLLLVLFLHSNGLVSPENEIYACYSLLAIFVISCLITAWHEINPFNFSFNDFYSKDSLMSAALSVLLVGSMFHQRVSIVFTGIFVAVALSYFLYNRKFYALNKAYWFLFLYAFLQFIGTIGTQKGFHFPDSTLSFYLLPISFCFFNLKRETLLKIARFFFRAMLIYTAVSIVYWWFNFLYLPISFDDWITGKFFFLSIPQSMQGLKDIGIIDLPAYYYVGGWSLYYNPTYTSMTLLFSFITGIYLYHKKKIPIYEVVVFTFLCFLVIALFESRVGITSFLIIFFASGVYWAKLRFRHIKSFLYVIAIPPIILLIISHDYILKFVDDPVRLIAYSLSFGYIKEHFWWGCGFQQEMITLAQQAAAMSLPDQQLSHSHNQFVGETVKYGVWGFISITLMVGYFIFYSIKSRNYLLQMFLLIMILFMIIEEPLSLQTGITRFSVFLTFFVAVGEHKKKIIDIKELTKKKTIKKD